MGDPVIESRQRILDAAVALFSEKGFDGARVSEIAKAAGVNKALIYYYFKSKDDILEGLISGFIDELMSFSIGAVTELFETDSMKITPDNVVSFGSQREKEQYMQVSARYLKSLASFLIGRRRVLRVLLVESLKKGPSGNILLRLTDILGTDGDLHRFSQSRGMDYTADQRLLIYKFFLGMIPAISLAVYYDDWIEHYGTSGEELEKGFIDMLSGIVPAIVEQFS